MKLSGIVAAASRESDSGIYHASKVRPTRDCIEVMHTFAHTVRGRTLYSCIPLERDVMKDEAVI